MSPDACALARRWRTPESVWRAGGAWLLTAALSLSGCSSPEPQEPPPPAPRPAARIAAAADLALALPDVADAFTTATGQRVELTFGASGLLLRQVVEGAPFDLFVSADETMVNVAIVRGACLRDTRSLYASGELSLWWRRDLPVDPPASLGDLAAARFRHIAIANPDSAPYGRVAKEALVAARVWDAVAPRLVYGENVRQALQFAQSGNAEVAVVGRAIASKSGGGTLPIDSTLHTPLRQALVVCSNGQNPGGGHAFAAFLVGPAGQAILRAHGFAPPAGGPAQ